MSQTKAQLVEGLNINTSAPADALVINSSGNVGIGTASPGTQLEIAGSASTLLRIDSSNGNGGVIRIRNGGADKHFFGSAADFMTGGTANQTAIRSNSDILFGISGNEKVRIDSSGRLLVGTTTEGEATADNLTIADSGHCGITLRSGTSSVGTIFFSDGTSGAAEYQGYVQYDHSANYLKWATAGTERFRVDASGRLLLGTTTEGHADAANLTVADTSDCGITIRSGASDFGSIYFSDATSGNGEHAGYIDYSHSNNSMRIGTNESTRLSIDSSGRLGIGTTSPANKLHVSDTSGSAQIRITGSSGSSNIYADSNIYFQPNGSTAVTFASSGNVGIGTSSFNSTASGRQILEINGASSSLINLDVGGTRKAYHFTDGTDVYSYNTANGNYVFGTNDSERMRIDSSGRLLLGTTTEGLADGNNLTIADSGPCGITLRSGSSSGGAIYFSDATSGSGEYAGFVEYLHSSDALRFATGGTERMRIDSSGNVTLGRAGTSLHFQNGFNNSTSRIQNGGGSNSSNFKFLVTNSGSESEAMRIDSSGRLLIGTSTNLSSAGGVQIYDSSPFLIGSKADNNPAQGAVLMGMAGFSQSGTSFENAAFVRCEAGGSTSSGNHPGQIVFGTIATGTSSAERMRITSGGDLLIGQTNGSFGTQGTILGAGGQAFHVVPNNTVLLLNRQGSDGEVVRIAQDDVTEGNISVSGSTVSYNGGHLSRWSQLAAGAARTEILRGSVLSNLDEMCEWGEEDNEQLNRMKVSNVEGDRNVSGVFQAWDDDDDTYVNDFYCAMTGDFVIRIAQGTTVARGDLLMSAGDGTAKPQDDDIVRSKTIAKVTSTTVSTTYSDNSYCVPCVLMAC